MSTIKSSAEDLTINADGSNEIKFQINAVEKASIDSSGAFTSTTIDATALTGNLPAISATNLTNVPAANITGTLPAIDGSSLTGIAGVPVGSEVTWTTATVPTGWLEENGAAISRTTYSDLYAVIGTWYGVGDGSSTFNLPDARGHFIRGFANGSGNDPDRASRTDRGDGTTGDVVGSKQSYGMQDHNHESSDPATATAGSQSWISRHVWAYGTGGYGDGHVRGHGGEQETRPRNTARMILIKY